MSNDSTSVFFTVESFIRVYCHCSVHCTVYCVLIVFMSLNGLHVLVLTGMLLHDVWARCTLHTTQSVPRRLDGWMDRWQTWFPYVLLHGEKAEAASSLEHQKKWKLPVDELIRENQNEYFGESGRFPIRDGVGVGVGVGAGVQKITV